MLETDTYTPYTHTHTHLTISHGTTPKMKMSTSARCGRSQQPNHTHTRRRAGKQSQTPLCTMAPGTRSVALLPLRLQLLEIRKEAPIQPLTLLSNPPHVLISLNCLPRWQQELRGQQRPTALRPTNRLHLCDPERFTEVQSGLI